MDHRKSFFKNPLAIASLGCLLAFAVACGDDDDDSNPAPSGGSKASGGSSGSAGKTNAGGNDSTAGKTGGGDAGETNTPEGGGGSGAGAGPGPGPGDGGSGGEAGAPVSCTDDTDMGCYSCKPKTLTQHLNACPTTGCEPFDNSALTSIGADGKLPDLP